MQRVRTCEKYRTLWEELQALSEKFWVVLIINKDRAWVLKAGLSEAAQLRGLLSNHRSHNWRTNGWLLWENQPKPLTRRRRGDLPLCALSFWEHCLTVFWLRNTWIQVHRICASLRRLDGASDLMEFFGVECSASNAARVRWAGATTKSSGGTGLCTQKAPVEANLFAQSLKKSSKN